MNAIMEAAKAGSGSQHTPTETPDTLHSVELARIVDAISEGPIKGFAHGGTNPLQDVYLNETPVANADGSLNFSNIIIDSRSGTIDQSSMPSFSNVENEIGVGVELRHSTPWVQAISDTSLSAIRLRVSVPQLQKSDGSTGDVLGMSITYTIELATDGGAFVLMETTGFTGKTTSEYDRTSRINLPPATTGWTLRVTRVTTNADSATIQDTTTIQSYTEIVDAKLRYPNTALVGIVVDAKQFSSIPTRAYDVYLRIISVPSNYDPTTRTYTGTWDGSFKLAWTDNPAWIFYDLITHTRYGLGQWVTPARINKWTLYTIAQYCDELVPDGKGGMEPRFTCNLYLQAQEDAYKVLGDLASVFRGMAFWAGGTVQATADMPGDPVFTYTNANVVDGKFTYQGSDLKTRYTVALVSWNDPDDFGRAKVTYVPDREGIARYGVRQTQVIAFGCSSLGQAQRAGLWALLTSRLETESGSWNVGQDGTLVAPGSIVRVADARRALSRQGGRVRSALTHTNLLPYSTDLSHWTASNGTASAGVTAPDGISTMRRIKANAGVTNAQLTETVAVTNGATYMLSAYVRRDQNRYVKLFGFGNGSGGAVIDLQTGATQINSTWLTVGVEMVDANVARICGTVQPISSGQVNIGLAGNMAGTAGFVGTEYIDVWGAQLEPGTTLTSLVTTQATGLTVTDVTLDAVPGVVAIGGTLTCTLPSGVTETQTISAIADNVVTVSTPYSELPLAESVWAAETSSLATQTFRVLNIREPQSSGTDSATFGVSAVQHVAGKFDAIDTGAMIVQPPTVLVSGGTLAPPSVVSVASYARKGTTRAIPVIEVGWPRVDGATRYLLQYRRDNGQWSPVHTVIGNHFELADAMPGDYVAQVAAANSQAVSMVTLSDPYTLDDSALTPDIIDDLQSEVSNAGTDATNALQQLAAIADDNTLSQGEKKAVLKDYNVLTTEQPGIDAQATSFGVTTEKTAYDGGITALTTYLATLTTPTLWSDQSGDTTIDGPTFRSKWQNAYTLRQALLNAIYAAAKAQAAAAQAAADANPVMNPRFVNDLSGWTFDTNGANEWTRSTGANSPDATISTFLVHKGITGQVTTCAHNTGGGLSVKPGEGMIATVALRAVGVNVGAHAYARIGWRDASGNAISNSTQGVSICTLDSGSNYFSQGVSRVYGFAPAGATRAIVEVEFDSHSSGTFTVTGASLAHAVGSADEVPESTARKWAGQSGADVTGSNTAYDTAHVSGSTAASVSDGAGRSLAGFDGSGYLTSGRHSLDLLADGGTYGRVRTGQLSGGIVRALATGRNFAPNPNFSFNSLGLGDGVGVFATGVIADGWTLMYGVATNAPAIHYASAIGSRILQGFPLPNGYSGGPMFASDTFAVSPSTSYVFRVVRTGIIGAGGIPANVTVMHRIYLNFQDKTGATVRNDVWDQPFTTTTGYDQIFTGSVPTNADRCQIYITLLLLNSGGATVWTAGASAYAEAYTDFVEYTQITALGTEVNGTLATQRNLPLVTWGNYGGGWSGLTLTYNTTTTTCAFSASAASYVGGGDSIAYNAGSVTVSGTAGSTVTYYLFYDDPSMTGGSKTLQATTSQITSLNANGRVLIGSAKVTYPTSGTGTGGGGTACPHVDAWVIRRGADGMPHYARAGTVEVDDYLLRADGRWGRVSYAQSVLAPGVRVTERHGHTLTCSASAPLQLADLNSVVAAHAAHRSIRARVVGADRLAQITSVKDVGTIWVRHITLEDDFFWVGDSPTFLFSHHNLKPIGNN